VAEACVGLWEKVKAKEANTPDLFLPMTHQSVADDCATINALSKHPELKGRTPVVLGGHDHEVHLEEHERSFLVKVGQDAESIGVVDIFWTEQGTPQTSVALLPAACFEPEPIAESFVQSQHVMLAEMMQLPLVELPMPMSSKRVRFEPSVLGSFFLGFAKRGLCDDGAEIAVLQGGCFRGNCDYNAGSFTLGDLYKEFKFETPFAVVSLPGWVVEDSVRSTRLAAKPAPQLLNLDDGCVVDADYRITLVDGRPFSRDRWYKVAIYQFLLDGLDGIEPLTSFVKAHLVVPDLETCLPIKQLVVSACMRDAWRNLLGLENKSPINTQTDAPSCVSPAFGAPSTTPSVSVKEPTVPFSLATPALFREKLQSAFDEIDRGDGIIDSRDLRAYMEAHSSCPGTLLIKRMIEALDSDGDARISRLDFSQLYLREEAVHLPGSSSSTNPHEGKMGANPPAPTNGMRPTIIYLEGGIGVGKSTALATLQEAFDSDPRVVLLQEPVEQWRQAGWLQDMYEGRMTKLEFQKNVLGTMVHPISSALSTPGVELIIAERSPRSCRSVFAAMNLTENEMVEFEREYDRTMIAHLDREVTILLDLDVKTLTDRIALRGRPEEQSIPASYHVALHEKHEELLSNLAHDKFRVDAAQGKEVVAREMMSIVSRYLPADTPSAQRGVEGGASRAQLMISGRNALADRSNANSQTPTGLKSARRQVGGVVTPKRISRKVIIDATFDAFSPLKTRCGR